MTRQVTAITAHSFMRDVVEASLHVPTLVEFSAPWCTPCRQLSPILDRLADEYAGRLRLTKVDTHDQQQLARQLGIRALPTVVLFKDGTSVAHFTGLRSEAYIRHLLAPHLPHQVDDLLRHVQALRTHGDFATASAVLHEALADEPGNIVYRTEAIALAALDGDLQAAQEELQSLQAVWSQHPAVRRLDALLTFSAVIAAQPDVRRLRAQADRQPGHWPVRHALAVHQLLGGDVEPALEYWLGMLRQPGAHRELMQRSLMLAFELIGEADPIVALSRQRMVRLLA